MKSIVNKKEHSMSKIRTLRVTIVTAAALFYCVVHVYAQNATIDQRLHVDVPTTLKQAKVVLDFGVSGCRILCQYRCPWPGAAQSHELREVAEYLLAQRGISERLNL